MASAMSPIWSASPDRAIEQETRRLLPKPERSRSRRKGNAENALFQKQNAIHEQLPGPLRAGRLDRPGRDGRGPGWREQNLSLHGGPAASQSAGGYVGGPPEAGPRAAGGRSRGMTQAPKRSAREQFDRQAGHYDTQWNAWSEETLEWLLANAQPEPEDQALDVATGTGFTALAFAPRVRAVTGVDVSPGMLAQARKRALEQGITNATFLEGPAEALPFPDRAFTLVTCRIAPHHFLSVPGFLRETARVLQPGGRFLMADTCVPDGDLEADAWQNAVETLRDPSHTRNYTPAQWREFIAAAGLKIEQLTSNGNGITMRLSEWMEKAGCAPAQAEAVRHTFERSEE